MTVRGGQHSMWGCSMTRPVCVPRSSARLRASTHTGRLARTPSALALGERCGSRMALESSWSRCTSSRGPSDAPSTCGSGASPRSERQGAKRRSWWAVISTPWGVRVVLNPWPRTKNDFLRVLFEQERLKTEIRLGQICQFELFKLVSKRKLKDKYRFFFNPETRDVYHKKQGEYLYR